MIPRFFTAAVSFLFLAILFAASSQRGFCADVYSQPPAAAGSLFQSSWWSPNGSDYDAYVLDDFTIQNPQIIKEIHWQGGYDPARFGSGGPVQDFTVSIYGSITGGSQPDILNPPLAKFQTGGNAGETSSGKLGGAAIFAYRSVLPVPFNATGGSKYWVQIVATQNGIPDWGIAPGKGGDGQHFRRIAGLADAVYQKVQGDTAFSLY